MLVALSANVILLVSKHPNTGLAQVQRSDRELARLYVEMFRPIGDAVSERCS